jgi:glycosyltransferase involved in cell wall biosynthesis
MKILQIVPFFTPLRGGSVVAPYHLSKELANRGHKVTVATTDFEFNEDYAQTLRSKGIDVIPFKCVANMGLFLYSPEMKLWLARNIRNFDIIHLHNFRSYQNNIVCTYSKRYDIPYVLQAHGSIPRIMEKQKLKKLYDLVWGYKLLRNASKLLALTNNEKDQYIEMYINDKNIELIPNGIDFSAFITLPNRNEFRKKYSLTSDEKLILFLGRIHKIKGLDILLESFSELCVVIDNIKLVIVGFDDGFLIPFKSNVEKLNLTSKVLFTGPLFGLDKLSAYVDCDVYVLPSSYDTFPITVIEAFACSIPVIVTDRCGIADIVGNQAGLVAPYDKDCLRDAILHMLSEDKLRQDFIKNGKLLVSERFNWEKIVAQVESIYLNCISAKEQDLITSSSKHK